MLARKQQVLAIVSNVCLVARQKRLAPLIYSYCQKEQL